MRNAPNGSRRGSGSQFYGPSRHRPTYVLQLTPGTVYVQPHPRGPAPLNTTFAGYGELAVTPITKADGGRVGNTFLLNYAFAGGGFGDSTADGWLKVFIRMVDLASDEYQWACLLWAEHGKRDEAKGTVAFTLPAAADHLELSVLSIRRALRCLEQLARAQGVPSVDRLKRRQLNALERQIVPIRDEVEHIDERIRDGLEEGHPNALLISEDGTSASVGALSVSTEAIYQCIMLLRDIAFQFATHRRVTT